METRNFIEQTEGADEMSMVLALCTVNEQLSITTFSTPAFNISDSVVKSRHTIQFPVCLKIIVTMNEDNVMVMHEEFGTTSG